MLALAQPSSLFSRMFKACADGEEESAASTAGTSVEKRMAAVEVEEGKRRLAGGAKEKRKQRRPKKTVLGSRQIYNCELKIKTGPCMSPLSGPGDTKAGSGVKIASMPSRNCH